MENRSQLQNEYHGLINKLNSTNRKANQKTEAVFSIQQLVNNQRNLAVTVNFEKYLSFGELTYKARLIIDADFQFQPFAEYIKATIKNAQTDDEIILAIGLAIDRLFTI
jgi:hypothetical protein